MLVSDISTAVTCAMYWCSSVLYKASLSSPSSQARHFCDVVAVGSTAEQATASTDRKSYGAMYMKEQQYSIASDEMIHCYLAIMAAPRFSYPVISSREPTWHCYPCSTEEFLIKRLGFCAKCSHCFSGSPLSVYTSTSTRSFRLWDAACSLRHSKHQLLRRRSIDVVWSLSRLPSIVLCVFFTQLESISTDDELRDLFGSAGHESDFILESGYSTPFLRITVIDVPKIIKTVCAPHCCYCEGRIGPTCGWVVSFWSALSAEVAS